MSASMYLSSPFDRLAIEADGGTVWIRSRNDLGYADNTIALRMTSADRDALRIALDALDTKEADEDLAVEGEAA
jgi:hypothetical protein